MFSVNELTVFTLQFGLGLEDSLSLNCFTESLEYAFFLATLQMCVCETVTINLSSKCVYFFACGARASAIFQFNCTKY
jgi:hypothetical protein